MKNFDPWCGDLARHFLPLEAKELQDKLAQYIQDEIENWLATLDADDVNPEEPAQW